MTSRQIIIMRNILIMWGITCFISGIVCAENILFAVMSFTLSFLFFFMGSMLKEKKNHFIR